MRPTLTSKQPLKKNRKGTDMDQHPEIEKFYKAQEEWDAFCQQNSDVLEHITTLLQNRDAALQLAEKVVRDNKLEGVTGFRVLNKYRKPNVGKLLASLGEEKFLAIGGTKCDDFSISAAALKEAVAKGLLSQEEYKNGTSEVVTYEIPKASLIP